MCAAIHCVFVEPAPWVQGEEEGKVNVLNQRLQSEGWMLGRGECEQLCLGPSWSASEGFDGEGPNGPGQTGVSMRGGGGERVAQTQ